jgi:hypothetical protein
MRRTFFRKGHVTGVTSGHVTVVTSGQVTSGHVTSSSTTAKHHRKCDLICAHILLRQVYSRFSTCSTKELSITITKILHAVKGGLLSYCDKVYSRGNINQKHRIGGVMVSLLASSAVGHGFEPRSGQTKDYKFGICCFSAKNAALRRKSKDWLARNRNNVSEWSDIFTRELLFQ